MVDDRLLVLLMEIQRTDVGMGFAFVGSAGLFVENPQESPDKWKMSPATMPKDRFRIIYGTGGMQIEEEHLYAMCPTASLGHDAFLFRWQAGGCPPRGFITARMPPTAAVDAAQSTRQAPHTHAAAGPGRVLNAFQ